ncbi:MAG: orotate phosphoribosyltransferase [Defluviitaleaceae bacterium]|nr:orotate phosphoribosyltransferase [Defluviitaleaceae bacterium]
MGQERIQQIFEECEALVHGHFLYTSGRHGDAYMQCAKVQQHPNHMEEIAKIIAKGFDGFQVDIVIAPAVGGIVFGYELARQLNAKSIFAERVDGKMELRRNFEIPKGAKVVVAEDVVTTGGSVREVIDAVAPHGGNIVGVAVIADRTGGKIDFGIPLVSGISREMASYTPDECPLCKEGLPIVKPGSRKI